MSSITAACRANKASKEGDHTLYIRLIKDRCTRFISPDVRLLPDQWDKRRKRVGAQHLNSALLNQFSIKKLAEAESIALQMHSRDAKAVFSATKKKLNSTRPGSFSDYFIAYKNWLLRHDKIGSYIKIKSGLAKLNGRRNYTDRSLEFHPRE